MAGIEPSTTLAHSKSPKVSRRTTFQDELQAAVSTRASKVKANQSYYSEDFDEDVPFTELLNSRKKRISAFRAGRSKTKINDFQLSDDEVENDRPKRVSFLKTQRGKSILPSDSPDNGPPESLDCHMQDASPAQHSKILNQDKNTESEKSDSDTPFVEGSREKSAESGVNTKLDSTQWDSPASLLSDGDRLASLLVSREDGKSSVGGEDTEPLNPPLETTEPIVPPKPKPRQKVLRVSSHPTEEQAEDLGSSLSRPFTSSVSILLSSTDRTSTSTTNTSSGSSNIKSHTLNGPEGDFLSSFSKSSSAKSLQSHSTSKFTNASGSKDRSFSDDSKECDEKYSTSFKELQEDSVDRSDHSTSRLSHTCGKSPDSRLSSSLAKSSKRTQSVGSYSAESKYLGTLKVLDLKVSLQESQPEAADPLRAAIYQDWLRKKKEMQETTRLKKQEEMLKEENRIKEEQTKKEDAKASFEAWKEKKAEYLHAKMKEKQEIFRKQQCKLDEKEEKRKSAKEVFEKWKQEQDKVRKEKYRKQKELENKIKKKKQEKEEERKKDSKSAFCSWDHKKRDAYNQKMKIEQSKKKTKEEEESYVKEERDNMALEMYEKWLVKKEREQRRQMEERNIQGILQEDPPPPWSPPNKTVPFRK